MCCATTHPTPQHPTHQPTTISAAYGSISTAYHAPSIPAISSTYTPIKTFLTRIGNLPSRWRSDLRPPHRWSDVTLFNSTMENRMIPVVKVGSMTVSLQTYKQMPKVAKTPEGYTLKVNGKEMKAPDIALTGGGAHPMYTYIQWEGKATWFGGQLPSGTEITIETPSAVTVAPATKPEEPEQPKQGKKQK